MEMEQATYLTVQALTKYIKRKFDRDPHLNGVYVKGEISNFKRHSSGHMYFTLKDEKARILAVMFSSQNQSLKFRPENGMNVLIRGDLSVYEAGGQYQIYVKDMQPDGIGALYLAYEQLKEKLKGAGYFDESRKKKIPSFPTKIAVVTSPTGAAIRDIITTIKRRYPIGEVLVYPALVQGEKAPASVAEAIHKVNEDPTIDVLIIGRGGGSIEELWAFNEEIVADAIAGSVIPIISAVGHETDFTIADFVADLRAPTPTAAGELAVPHIDDLLERVMNRKLRLIKAFKNRLNHDRQRLETLRRSYSLRNPHLVYQQKMEQLDRLNEKMDRAATSRLKEQQDHTAQLTERMRRLHPDRMIKLQGERLQSIQNRLEKQYASGLKEKRQQFLSILSTMEALSPLKVMERGYSLSYNEDDSLITSVAQVQKGQSLTVRVKDGQIHCKADSIEERETHAESKEE
jgi:exodeoxyribonuclease VII large subunit